MESQKRILLAEDQAEVRQTLRMLIELEQYSVTEASNGQEALGLFKAGAFDLVITDYVMPEMRGDALAANIKQMAPSQPILMITAYADDLNGSEIPVDAILRKPFSYEELRQTMARLLA